MQKSKPIRKVYHILDKNLSKNTCAYIDLNTNDIVWLNNPEINNIPKNIKNLWVKLDKNKIIKEFI